MGKGGGGGTQTVVNTQEIPGFIQDQLKETFNIVENFKPNPNTVAGVAGFTPDQLAYQQSLKNFAQNTPMGTAIAQQTFQDIAQNSQIGTGNLQNLLGQNVNSYNFEGISFSSLIYSLAEIDEIKRIRFMTSHPRDMTDELINAFGAIPKLMPFLHLPVQSGSNRILKSMNRGHVVEEYVEIINKLRFIRKDICFSSDFIVGYPGETDKDFQETIDLCKQVQFAQAYSFNYSSRPGTPASRKEELDENLKKTRLHVLQDLLNNQQTSFLNEQKNRIHKVLFEKIGRGIDEYVGRTEQFSPVTVVSKENIVGEIRMVKINSVMSHSLKGVLK